MQRPPAQTARPKPPRVRVFDGDGTGEEADRANREFAEQDRPEHETAKAEMFWAGRNFAMRHSARVAA